MQFMQGIDGMMQGADDRVNQLIGDGKDPEMAPPGQFSMDAYMVLEGMPQCQITEKASAIEAASALVLDQEIEMPNKYKVLTPEGQQAFFIVETTDACTRQCKGCCNDCASWNVEMRVLNQAGQAEQAFHFDRPWTCTCCCFNRPKVSITDQKTGEEIAELEDPCNCCDMTFKVFEKGDDPTMYVKGGCCQWGLCCPLPCGPCAEVHFSAEDAEGQEIGSITKRVPSMLKFLATPDVDNYHVDMEGLDPAQKIALMAISIFIDFRYFSENANANDSDGDHIPDRFDWSDDQ